MPPRPRLALRLAAGYGLLALVILLLAGGILWTHGRWERDRQSLLGETLPRFSDMLAINRLGDALAESAGALAIARTGDERTRALSTIREAQDALTQRLTGLNGSPLEAATRDRLKGALADLVTSLDSLDALVTRRFDLHDATAHATARLAILGDLLPDMEKALLAGRVPQTLPDFLTVPDDLAVSGPSGTRQADAIRLWSRNAQVAVGMLLATTGAPAASDLEYLSLRADESLRRAGSVIRRADRGIIPLLEAVQGELSALAQGAEGRDGVVRLRQQRLSLEQNAPAVLTRSRQASDRLTAAVAQIIADLEQSLTLHRAALGQEHVMWGIGTLILSVLGIGIAGVGAGLVWQNLVVRLRALVQATRDAAAGDALVLPKGADRADELGALTRAVAALDRVRPPLAQSAKAETGAAHRE